MTKSSQVSIVGMPNAGKSTLLNRVLGQKISIVTHKVQTTRSAIKGILTENNTQIVFIDTPGIFTPKKKLEKSMVRCAWSSIIGSDFVCIIISIESLKSLNAEFQKLLSHLSKVPGKKIILFNKVDKLGIKNLEEDLFKKSILDFIGERGKESAINNLEYINNLFKDAKKFYISALKEQNIKEFIKYLQENSNEAPYYYGEEEVTDAPIKFLCNEITREKLFLALDQELPYNLTVETEKWEQISEKEVKIYQNIIVSRESHKMIILGKGGENIKKIGTKAREEISRNFDLKAHLFLFIKVRPGWDEQSLYYQNMGLSLNG